MDAPSCRYNFWIKKIQSSYLAADKTFIFGRFQSSHTPKIKGKLKLQWTCHWCCHPWLCIRCCGNIVAIHDCASRYSLLSTFLAQPSHPHTLWRNIFLCFFRVITVANAWSLWLHKKCGIQFSVQDKMLYESCGIGSKNPLVEVINKNGIFVFSRL